jgi:hypothetical protein
MSNTYFVSGKVLIRPFGSDDPFQWVGLALEASISVAQQEFSLPNRATPGGGNYDAISRIDAVTLSMTLGERKPDVLAYALFGENAAPASAAVVAEEHEATPDGYIQLAHPGPYTLVTVTDDATSPGAIPTAGNWELTSGGLHIFADADDIEDGDVIKVSYTYPAYDRIEAVTRSAPELEIHFNGENEADNSYPRNAKLWRVKLAPIDNIALISADDFSTFTVTGEILIDTSKTGDGISQYFRLDQVQSP